MYLESAPGTPNNIQKQHIATEVQQDATQLSNFKRVYWTVDCLYEMLKRGEHNSTVCLGWAVTIFLYFVCSNVAGVSIRSFMGLISLHSPQQPLFYHFHGFRNFWYFHPVFTQRSHAFFSIKLLQQSSLGSAVISKGMSAHERGQLVASSAINSAIGSSIFGFISAILLYCMKAGHKIIRDNKDTLCVIFIFLLASSFSSNVIGNALDIKGLAKQNDRLCVARNILGGLIIHLLSFLAFFLAKAPPRSNASVLKEDV